MRTPACTEGTGGPARRKQIYLEEELFLESPWGTEPSLELGGERGGSFVPGSGLGLQLRQGKVREGEAVENRGGARMEPRRWAPQAR